MAGVLVVVRHDCFRLCCLSRSSDSCDLAWCSSLEFVMREKEEDLTQRNKEEKKELQQVPCLRSQIIPRFLSKQG